MLPGAALSLCLRTHQSVCGQIFTTGLLVRRCALSLDSRPSLLPENLWFPFPSGVRQDQVPYHSSIRYLTAIFVKVMGEKNLTVISIFWIKFIIFHFNWLWISFTINFHFTYFSVHTSCFFLTDLWNLFAYEENQSCINQIVKNTFSTLYHSYDTEVLNLDIKSIDFGFKVLCPPLL